VTSVRLLRDHSGSFQNEYINDLVAALSSTSPLAAVQRGSVTANKSISKILNQHFKPELLRITDKIALNY
jgi:hypothetical protein